MPKVTTILGLDVGEKRIGVAVADSEVRIAIPYDTVTVDGSELQSIAEIYTREKAEVLVVGYPRNQAGEPTAQTKFVTDFAEKLTDMSSNIVFQDESLTSVMAEQQLASYQKPYTKADIDAQAAAIILNDYLEETYGK
ncbi:Holliday junction resolvase RuvX [Candidatus Saccharibacteria bacterium]|nr:Holliday junction resolvase RuvX [Candidatus Saccharibacteria bacterium]